MVVNEVKNMTCPWPCSAKKIAPFTFLFCMLSHLKRNLKHTLSKFLVWSHFRVIVPGFFVNFTKLSGCN